MQVSLVWAQGQNGAIGRAGVMPWHLPEDLAHFKAETLGAPVIMGRRTWESLPEKFRPLPGRLNVVVSRDPLTVVPGALLVESLETAMQQCATNDRVWVIGGGQIYRAAIPFATELVVTRIHVEIADADTFAPEIDDSWKLVRETAQKTSDTGLQYHFEWYSRVQDA